MNCCLVNFPENVGRKRKYDTVRRIRPPTNISGASTLRTRPGSQEEKQKITPTPVASLPGCTIPLADAHDIPSLSHTHTHTFAHPICSVLISTIPGGIFLGQVSFFLAMRTSVLQTNVKHL